MKKKVVVYTTKKCPDYRIPNRWPNGVPAVYDCAGNLVCICPEDHGVAFADGIARSLNIQSDSLLEKAK